MTEIQNRKAAGTVAGTSRKTEITHTLILMLGAFIWGTAFVAQSVGAEYISAVSFNGIRSWFAAAFLIPVILIKDRISLARDMKRGAVNFDADGMRGSKGRVADRKMLIMGSNACGFFLCFATLSQQIGIRYTTTAKAGFITALYVVIVPVITIFIGKKPGIKLWICVAMGVIGLYLLSMKGVEGIGFGDAMMIVCAFLFSFQILSANHFLQFVDPVKLCCGQMLVTALICTVLMLFTGIPSGADLAGAMPSLLYAGLLSGGVAYTLQLAGQKGLNPTVASLTMSLESVFSALAGWVVLGQVLTGRELLGCVIMFAAIVLSQI